MFRKQTNLVQVEFAYKGEPATVTPEVRLSTSNGWRWTLPPGAQVDATSGEGAGMVTLDLNALQAQAEAGAAAAGIPASDLTITVIPTATTSAGDFKPELPLKLSTQSLTLADGEESLVADESKDGSTLSVQPNSVTFLGMSIGVWPMRILGLLLLVGGVVAWLALQRRRPAPGVADMAAVHRHRELIIKVAAVDEHGMCIDVADLDSLVRLAKRYALMILQVEGGAGGAGDMYYVQDESVTYRWTPSGIGEGGGWGGDAYGAGGGSSVGGGGAGSGGGRGAPGSSNSPPSPPSDGGSPNMPADPPFRTPASGPVQSRPAGEQPVRSRGAGTPQETGSPQGSVPIPSPPSAPWTPTEAAAPSVPTPVTTSAPWTPTAAGGSSAPIPTPPSAPRTPTPAGRPPAPIPSPSSAPWTPTPAGRPSAPPPTTAPFAAPPPVGPPVSGAAPEDPPRPV